MPRMLKNETKLISLSILRSALNAMAQAAVTASTVDAKLVELSARGFQNATRWTSDTTVMNRDKLAHDSRMVLNSAESQVIQTNLTRAVVNFGHALATFEKCNYNGANLYADSARKLLAT